MLDPKVLDVMMPYMKELYGNSSCQHDLGISSQYAINKSRVQISSNLNCLPENIFFTSGATESNNIILNNFKGGCIVTSITEHPSVYETCMHMFKSETCNVQFIKPKSIFGCFAINEIENVLKNNNVSLASFMLVNNETGNINVDIDNIIELCHKYNVPVHTDLTQAIGKIKIDFEKLNVDFASFSSHKIHGPKGVGGLYISSKYLNSIKPLCFGGVQEFGLRPGTENVPGIVGFGEAMSLTCNDIDIHIKNMDYLKSELRKSLSKFSDESGFNIMYFTDRIGSSPNTLFFSIAFNDLDMNDFMNYMRENSICISSGSACNEKDRKPSRNISTFGFSTQMSLSSIRISLSRFNTLDEVHKFMDIFKKYYKK
jgi:cysteine desulfurase